MYPTSTSPKPASNSTKTLSKQTIPIRFLRCLAICPELRLSVVPLMMGTQNIACLSPPPRPARLTDPGALRKHILPTRPIWLPP